MPNQDQPDPKTEQNERLQSTPSQAEGDRETVEQDLRERFEQGGKPVAGGGDPISTPSQAEGDRDTIDRDLEEKGLDR